MNIGGWCGIILLLQMMEDEMDWNLFWSAFEAIGTTLGSFITAIALIVAIKQYKQPLEKKIDVKITSAFHVREMNESRELYCFSIMNKGIRTVIINSIYVISNKQKIVLTGLQYRFSVNVVFPEQVEPERSLDIYFDVDDFKNILRQAINDNILKPNNRLTIMAQDSLGDEYVCKTKIKICEILK